MSPHLCNNRGGENTIEQEIIKAANFHEWLSSYNLNKFHESHKAHIELHEVYTIKDTPKEDKPKVLHSVHNHFCKRTTSL